MIKKLRLKTKQNKEKKEKYENKGNTKQQRSKIKVEKTNLLKIF